MKARSSVTVQHPGMSPPWVLGALLVPSLSPPSQPSQPHSTYDLNHSTVQNRVLTCRRQARSTVLGDPGGPWFWSRLDLPTCKYFPELSPERTRAHGVTVLRSRLCIPMSQRL